MTTGSQPLFQVDVARPTGGSLHLASDGTLRVKQGEERHRHSRIVGSQVPSRATRRASGSTRARRSQLRQVRPHHRPGQERHRHRTGGGRRELSLHRAHRHPRRLCEVRGAAGERKPRQPELCASRREVRCEVDVREAGRGHLLRDQDRQHEVQDQAGRGALHGAERQHRLRRSLHELLRRLHVERLCNDDHVGYDHHHFVDPELRPHRRQLQSPVRYTAVLRHRHDLHRGRPRRGRLLPRSVYPAVRLPPPEHVPRGRLLFPFRHLLRRRCSLLRRVQREWRCVQLVSRTRDTLVGTDGFDEAVF